jgi:membrane-associated protease RseP (regulator of RpoE activity)
VPARLPIRKFVLESANEGRGVMAKNIATAILLCAVSLTCFYQETEPRYVTGMTLFGPSPSCPIFVGGVVRGSPAAAAGIKAGDRLIAINGVPIADLQDAARAINGESAEPVSLRLARGEESYAVTVQKETMATRMKRDGQKTVEDSVMPLDATDAEIKQRSSMIRDLDADPTRIARLFPTHYPENEKLYYPGFEVFVWDKGRQVTIGGIEDGPASRAGARWGDIILSVNGIDPRNKSVAGLEPVFSSQKPETMTLVINRAGVTKTLSFELAQATTVLRDNDKKLVRGTLVPIWVSEEYLQCFGVPPKSPRSGANSR